MMARLKAAAEKVVKPEIFWVGIFILKHRSQIQGWDTVTTVTGDCVYW